MTLAELLNPGFDYYRSIADLSRALRLLLKSAEPYRVKPDRGSTFGPHETLIGYDGCRGCQSISWHSNRNPKVRNHVSTWQQTHDFLYGCILRAICNPDVGGWREAESISLGTKLRLKRSYSATNEQEAWSRFTALHGFKLPVATLNSQHRGVNVLAAPELVVGVDGVTVRCRVTSRAEMRRSPDTFSRWDVCFLLRERQYQWPRWRWQKETFAAFIARACEYYEKAGQE